MRVLKPIALMLALVIGSAAASQVPSTTSLEELEGFDEDVRALVDRYQAPGIAVAIIREGEIVHVSNIGVRDIESGAPVTGQTQFGIGSVVKSFTSGLIGTLSPQEISLDASPALYLSDLEDAPSFAASEMTLRDLLSQSSGLPPFDANLSFFAGDDRRELLARLHAFEPSGAPGARWSYNNLNFITLDAVSEAVTGQSKSELFAHRLFDPVGMGDTLATTRAFRESPDAATGYGMIDGQAVPVALERMFGEQVYTTAPDLARWLWVWMNGGKVGDRQVIPPDYVAQAIAMQEIVDGAAPTADEPDAYLHGYGYGWFVKSAGGNYVVHHGGNENGFSTHVLYVPARGFGVVALTNQQNSILPNVVTDMALRRLTGMPALSADSYPVVVRDIAPLLPRESACGKDGEQGAPSLPASALAGTYRAEGYGEVVIDNEGCMLAMRSPLGTFALLHREGRKFGLGLIERVPGGINADFFELTFEEGDSPPGLLFNIASEPVRFVRIPAETSPD